MTGVFTLGNQLNIDCHVMFRVNHYPRIAVVFKTRDIKRGLKIPLSASFQRIGRKRHQL